MKYENLIYGKDIENTKNVAIIATINGLASSVPLDPANSDYAEIMQQVAAGTLTIADAD